MNKEKDFFKTCFNTVTGLEVKNENEAIAKEVVLSEIERLQQENRKQKEVIDKATEYIKERFYFNEENGEYSLLHTIDKDNIKELLDILNEVSK